MCANSGAVVAVTYLAARRPVLERAVIFLASGEILWADAASSGAGRAGTIERRGSEAAAGFGLRLSAQATPLTGASEIAGDEPGPGRAVPVSFTLDLEPASIEATIGNQPPGATRPTRALMVRGSGSLAAGSVIYRVHGSGWSSSGRSDDDGELTDSRARAVFQDGSGLFATRPADAAAGPGGAALVINTHIRQVPAREFVVMGRDRGPARRIAWTGGGRSPQSVTGEIRDVDQSVTSVLAVPDGGRLSWSMTPFVFVRSGITGLGLMERTTQAGSAPVAPAVEDTLPDPY
jgi:hypothetical protein